jgi:hypothetical protein
VDRRRLNSSEQIPNKDLPTRGAGSSVRVIAQAERNPESRRTGDDNCHHSFTVEAANFESVG